MIRIIIYYSGVIRKSWKWKAKAANGEILASGKGFNSKALARESVNLLTGKIKNDQYIILEK